LPGPSYLFRNGLRVWVGRWPPFRQVHGIPPFTEVLLDRIMTAYFDLGWEPGDPLSFQAAGTALRSRLYKHPRVRPSLLPLRVPVTSSSPSLLRPFRAPIFCQPLAAVFHPGPHRPTPITPVSSAYFYLIFSILLRNASNPYFAGVDKKHEGLQPLAPSFTGKS